MTTTYRDDTAILTEPFGFGRLIRALLPVWYATLMHPKQFFGAINRVSGPQLRNALAFMAITLALYVIIQTVFEEVLIRAFGYEGTTFVAYYAVDFAAYGAPVAEFVSFGTVFAIFAAVTGVSVFYVAASMWVFLRTFVHFGEVASFKSVLVAVVYAASFVTLTFCMMSVPLVLLADRDSPTSLFYAFGPLTASGDASPAMYQVALTYIYLRAVAFTTNIMLHWGLVFTILLVGGVAWVAQVI
jgi:hypothetical protein